MFFFGGGEEKKHWENLKEFCKRKKLLFAGHQRGVGGLGPGQGIAAGGGDHGQEIGEVGGPGLALGTERRNVCNEKKSEKEEGKVYLQ